MKKILQSPKRIKFSDCDPMGHLYNAKYIQYLLDAREDQVEAAYGFNPIEHVRETGQGWAVVQNQISYLRAVLYNETVICETFLRAFNSRVMEIECTMWDDQRQRIKTVLWTKFVYMNARKHKAANHSVELMDMFAQVLVPIEHDSFEDRVAYFRNLNKA